MAYSVDWPNAEYHEILPNLYLGGHTWMEGGRVKSGKHSKMSEDSTWDYVISAWFDGHHPQTFPLCDTRFVIFNDTERGLADHIWDRIRFAVDQAVWRWQQGQKVLIRCQAGYNRSGLMMCLALMRLGFTAEHAINQVRKRRGPDVLINPVFERYVYDHEEDYLDPTAFAATEALMNELVPVLK